MSPLQVAAKVHECRESARTLLGADYPARITEWKQLVQQEMQRTGCKPLEAAMSINKTVVGTDGDGFKMLMIFAATAEILAPIEAVS